MTNRNKKGKGGKGGKIALIVCFVVIIALVGVIGYLLLHDEDNEDNPSKRNVVVNEENAEQVASEMIGQEKTPAGFYQVTMNSTWNFTSGDAASENAYVENANANTNSVYFDIVRNDTEETIYESPILPVGTHLEEITLDTVLPAGTYDCVMIYHLLDENDEPVSSLNMGLTIVIEN